MHTVRRQVLQHGQRGEVRDCVRDGAGAEVRHQGGEVVQGDRPAGVHHRPGEEVRDKVGTNIAEIVCISFDIVQV